VTLQYRIFRNPDPPGLAEIWNDVCVNRGGYELRNPSLLERWVFSKPYFDPNGLVLAEDNGKLVGFAHAGFGPNEDQTWLAPEVGVICAIMVRPSHRGRGVGATLLRHSEEYLRELGAKQICAGGMRPYNPFYFGLYGGSDSPGFLNSDRDAASFFEYHGYEGWNTALVFQRKLNQPVNLTDPKFNMIRRRYEVQMVPRTTLGTWWQECMLGLLEPVEFRLEDKLTGLPAARVMIWEMEGFATRWNAPSAGVLDLQVRPDLRRQGLGKYLVLQVMKHLQDQYFGIIEAQAMERNQAAVSLFRTLGFEQSDVGRIYQKVREDDDR
jgi:ribosomal protein S18 acetylase RimI-like enzyme